MVLDLAEGLNIVAGTALGSSAKSIHDRIQDEKFRRQFAKEALGEIEALSGVSNKDLRALLKNSAFLNSVAGTSTAAGEIEAAEVLAQRVFSELDPQTVAHCIEELADVFITLALSDAKPVDRIIYGSTVKNRELIKQVRDDLVRNADSVPGDGGAIASDDTTIQVVPVNGQGINIFHRLSETPQNLHDEYFVKLQLLIWTRYAISVSNVELEYDGPPSWKLSGPLIKFDDDAYAKTDPSYRMVKPRRIEEDHAATIFVSQRFGCERTAADSSDYRIVTVRLEVSGGGVGGHRTLVFTGKLEAGGVLSDVTSTLEGFRSDSG